MPAAEGHTRCLLRLTELWAAPHTLPSKGSWGALPEGSRTPNLLPPDPQGTKPHLSQPNKPRHWLAPFLEMGEPLWASSVPSIQCPAWAPSSPEVPPTLFPLLFNPTLLCLEAAYRRFQLPAHFWLHLSHSHSTVGLQTDPFWTTPEARAAPAQRKGSLRSTAILYGIIPLFVKLSLPSFHKSFQFPFHTQRKLKLGLPPLLNFHWRQNFEFIILCHMRKARIWILNRAP